MTHELTALLVSSVASCALCALLALVGRRLRYDASSPHDRRLPFLGAVLWLATALGIALGSPSPYRPQMATVVGAAGALFIVGWLTELLDVAPARAIKWLAAFAAGWALAESGIVIELVKLPGVGRFWQPGPLAVPLTALWCAVVTCLILVANRADGLVPGVASLSAAALWAVAAIAGVHTQHPEHARILAGALFGSALFCTIWALLGLNFRVGVGGSLATGAMLAAVTVLGLLKHTAFLILIVPALVLSAPILSGTMAYVYHRRLGLGTLLVSRERRSLVEVLVRRGMTSRQAVLFLLAWHACVCGVAVLLTAMIRAHYAWKSLMLVGLVVGAAAFFYVTFKIAFAWRWISTGALPQEVAESARLSEQVNLLGVRVDRINLADTLARIVEFIESRTPHVIVTSDVSAVVRARSDPELAQIMASADLVTADGAGVVWGARLLDVPFVERVSGCDLVEHLCGLAAERGFSVYLLGAAPGVAERAGKALTERYPALRVAGTFHGYFGEEEEPEVVARVAAAKPDILFVAMGIPKQEKWISRHLGELNVPVCMGVGGSFDVIAGDVPRAPMWMRRCGLEWLWRSVRDPRRLPRLVALPKFFLLLLWSRLQRRSDSGEVA